MRLRWKIAQAAEIRWWQNYLGGKPVGEYLDWKQGYWADLLEKMQIKTKAGDTIVDIGCGPAGIFMAFAENEVVAVDPLMDSYQEKIKHFDPKMYPKVQFINAPIEGYKPSGKFDQVYCLNAINHVSDLGKGFDNVIQLAKPGGTLIISIDAHNYGFFKHLFRALPGDILHPHQYDLEEYKNMITERGCRIEQVELFKKEFLFDYYVIKCVKE